VLGSAAISETRYALPLDDVGGIGTNRDTRR
jgi:hypothetical protein